jgi:hypothetical protein
MMNSILLSGILFASTTFQLNVMSMVDGAELNVDEYLLVQNYNDASNPYGVEGRADLKQILTVDIVRSLFPLVLQLPGVLDYCELEPRV